MKNNKSKSKGRSFVSALCKIIGIIIILLVIVSSLVLIVPRAMGYEAYNVETGSMSPGIPAGSIIFVKNIAPEDIVQGDVITYSSGASMVTHRVVENKKTEREFITKGDANANEDITPVSYAAFIGKVEKHFPVIGRLLAVYSTTMGKLFVLAFAAGGVLLFILGAALKKK